MYPVLSDLTYEQLARMRVRKVRKAERATGFKEGRYEHNDRTGRVRVAFYPAESWWFTYDSGRNSANSLELTPELWAELKPITNGA